MLLQMASDRCWRCLALLQQLAPPASTPTAATGDDDSELGAWGLHAVTAFDPAMHDVRVACWPACLSPERADAVVLVLCESLDCTSRRSALDLLSMLCRLLPTYACRPLARSGTHRCVAYTTTSSSMTSSFSSSGS